MRLSIIGATGFIGSRILDEALRRRHDIVAIARHPGKLQPGAGLAVVSADTAEPSVLARHLAGSEACIVAVPWTQNDIGNILSAVRRAWVARLIVVVGAGSLHMPDRRLWLDHMIEQGIAPPTSRKALEALEALRGVKDLDWTAFSPAADIEPGERTGVYRLGQDDLLVDEDGRSRISDKDFAMAVLDEVEGGTAGHRRITVAY